MNPILVLYATREGQTRKIAEHLAVTLRSRELPVEVMDAARLPAAFNLASFDAAVLAASIHAGKHEPEMFRFVKEHREELGRMPSAFLSVSLTEATAEDRSSPPEKQVAAARMVGRLRMKSMLGGVWRTPSLLRSDRKRSRSPIKGENGRAQAERDDHEPRERPDVRNP